MQRSVAYVFQPRLCRPARVPADVPELLQVLAYQGVLPEALRRSRAAWQLASAACDYLCRHLLHLTICAVVLMSPHIWSSPVYFMLAFNGMLYVNYVNFTDLCAPASGSQRAERARQPHSKESERVLTEPGYGQCIEPVRGG